MFQRLEGNSYVLFLFAKPCLFFTQNPHIGKKSFRYLMSLTILFTAAVLETEVLHMHGSKISANTIENNSSVRGSVEIVY